MRILKKDTENIQYGFVCAGFSPTAGRTIYSKHGKAYLHIIFLKLENMYVFHKMTPFHKENIPFPFSKQEFTIFYGEKPPKLSNVKNKAVNEIIQNVMLN